jgi:hypothetical protein
MGKLGDFLEVVYGPAEGFRTVRASVHHWRKRVPKPSRHGKKRASADQRAEIAEDEISVMIARPDKVRVEGTRQRGCGTPSFLTIVNGKNGWEVDDQGHVEIYNADEGRTPSLSDIDRHFNRAMLRQFFVSLDLQEVGGVRAADRDCVRLRAVPRADRPGLWPHWLPPGADEYEFHADPARGVVLAIIARYAGNVFAINDVTEVTFDEKIDESLFNYTCLAGQQARPADTIVERLTLDAAAARVAFTVFVPTRLPDPGRAQCDVLYHPARMRSPREEVSLMYRGSRQYEHLWIVESATPDPEHSELEFEPVSREEREFQLSDPGIEGTRILTFQQQGTQIAITSDLPCEQLLDLACSFVAVPRHSPSL